MASRTSTERDPDILREMNRLLELENALLHERITTLAEEVATLKGDTAPEQLELEVAALREKLGQFQRKVFGESSERRPRQKSPKETAVQRGHGPRPQEKLPRVDTVVELAGDDRACPACNGTLEAIEGATEDAELIDVVERQFIVRKIKRQKYRCLCNGAIETAPVPPKHIASGRYSLDFAAHVLARKYAWHDPLDRQRRAMAELGLEVTSQTLWDQVEALAGKLTPISEALREYILRADVIGVDETFWRLMNRKLTKKWWVWAMQSRDAVYYQVAPSRSAATAAALVGDFEGVIVCDAYKAYQTLAKSRPNLTLALCWSHVRRKLVDAEPDYPVCGDAIDLIGQLFAIDRDTIDPALLGGDAKIDAASARLAARQEHAPPILDALRDWALTQRALPKSSLRKAIDYMLGHWRGLSTFVDDPFVPLDNNATERVLRGLVVGRKNHYGSRSVRGTQVAATSYCLVETAKLNALDPQAYLSAAYAGLDAGEPPARLMPLRDLWL